MKGVMVWFAAVLAVATLVLAGPRDRIGDDGDLRTAASKYWASDDSDSDSDSDGDSDSDDSDEDSDTDDGDNGDGGEVIEFAVSRVFFEFNATDLDLGIHIFFDAVGWEEVEVEGPDGTIFEVENDGSLKEIGSTEVFTESAEPPLVEDPDDFDPEELAEAIAAFLAMFPEGTYEFEGTTVDGDTLEGSAELTHDMPAAPVILSPTEDVPADPDDFVVEWCVDDFDPEIVSYEVVVEFAELDEFEEETGRVFKWVAGVPADPDALCPDSQSLTVPADWFESLEVLDGEYKAEVLSMEPGFNATITENGFELVD